MFALLLAFALSQARPRIVAGKSLKDVSPACDLCRSIVGIVDELLEDKKLEEEIIEAIIEYCQLLPSPYNSLCSAYAESGISVVISYIEQGFDAFDICAKIHLCESQETKALTRLNQMYPEKDSNGLVDCPVCLTAVDYIKRQLEKGKVQESIAGLLAQLCDRLPDSLSPTCKNLVLEYVPQILVLIDSKLESGAVCASLGMCEGVIKNGKRIGRIPQKYSIPKNVKYVPIEPLAHPEGYVQATGCDMCSKLVDFIEKLLADQAVESEITKLVEELCTTFQAPYSSICNTFVETLLPTVLIWIQGGISKLDICTKIGLC